MVTNLSGPVERWVEIDPNTNRVVSIFMWNGVNQLDETQNIREKFDPNRHPHPQYGLEVGEGWWERWLEKKDLEPTEEMLQWTKKKSPIEAAPTPTGGDT